MVSLSPFCLLLLLESANDWQNKRKFSRTYAVGARVLFKSAEPMLLWQGFCTSAVVARVLQSSRTYAVVARVLFKLVSVHSYLVRRCCVVETFKSQRRPKTDTVSFLFHTGEPESQPPRLPSPAGFQQEAQGPGTVGLAPFRP